MSRAIDPAQPYTRGGKPLDAGKMFYLEPGKETPKTTFASIDEDPKSKNTNPVILDAAGVLPNVFYTGLVDQILTDKNDEQIFKLKNIGLDIGISAFDAFSAGATYQINNIVTTTDGRFWKSVVNGNIGFSPVSDDGTHWQEIDFNDFYAAGVTYKKLDPVISTVDGLTYISVKDSNKGNEPSIDTGINWVLDRPALDWVTGKTYAIGEKAFSTVDNRTYKAVTSQAGNEPSVDSGTNWLPTDGVVVKPVNVSPADSDEGVSRSPILTGNAYSIVGGTSEHEWSRYLLSEDSFNTLFYDSGITRDLISNTVDIRLNPATIYSFKIERRGVRTDVSDFSDVTTFTTVLPLSLSFSNDLVTGTAAARTLSNGVDLSSVSGFVLIVNKDTVDSMRFCSTVRGVGVSSSVGVFTAEASEPTGLTAFNIDGYSVGALASYNGSGDDIYSVVFQQIANIAEIVSFTGNATNRTISHSLGKVPGTYFIINLVTGGWSMRHNAENVSSSYLTFGDTNQALNDATRFNSLAATSTLFSVGTSPATNGSGNSCLAILWPNDSGSGIVSGFYTGTGTSGNKVVVNFAVGTLFLKNVSSSEDWVIADIKMGTSTHISLDSIAQGAAGSVQSFDSDGFTLSSIANSVGDSYYFVAIADRTKF